MSWSGTGQSAPARAPFAPLAWRLLAVLLAGAALGGVVAMNKSDLEPVIPQVRLKPAPAPAPADAAAKPATTTYPAITERPLFFASRKPWHPPPPPKPPPVVKAPPKLTGYTAVGIVQSGETRFALIKPKSGKTIMLGLGGTLDGWTLTTITGDRLGFVSGSTNFDMTLPKLSEKRP
jgi:hypothetical protein